MDYKPYYRNFQKGQKSIPAKYKVPNGKNWVPAPSYYNFELLNFFYAFEHCIQWGWCIDVSIAKRPGGTYMFNTHVSHVCVVYNTTNKKNGNIVGSKCLYVYKYPIFSNVGREKKRETDDRRRHITSTHLYLVPNDKRLDWLATGCAKPLRKRGPIP